MKKILTALLISTSLLINVAHSGAYIGIDAGVAIPTDIDATTSNGIPGVITADVGGAVSLAAGYRFENNIRLEGEVAFQQNTVNAINGFSTYADTKSVAALFNGYYDFVNDSKFTPYVGAGIGVAGIYSNSNVNRFLNNDATVFVYQISAGVDYAISDKFSIGAKYRFFGAPSVEFDALTTEYQSNNIYVGAKFHF